MDELHISKENIIRNAMQEQMLNTQYGVTEGMKTGVDKIGTEEIRKAHQTLLKYKEG